MVHFVPSPSPFSLPQIPQIVPMADQPEVPQVVPSTTSPPAPSAAYNASEPIWECSTDKGYTKYSPDLCAKLNAALKAGKTSYSCNFNNYPYVIDFTIMKQINQSTQRARDIRKAPTPGKSLSLGSHLTPLATTAPDYIMIKGLFDKTMTGHYKTLNITLLTNPYAKSRFDNCFNFIKLDNCVPPKTMLLFHGTSNVPPKSIYDGYYENFDVAHAKYGLWGRGIYFSSDALYSCTNYAYQGNKNTYSILVGEVIVGNYYDYNNIEARTLVHPPNLPGDPYRRYDSVSGITNGTRVYIIYTSNQAYAKYLITYTV